MTSIAVIVGSTREGSFNRVLGELTAASLEAQGARVTRIDLAAFDLPLYSAALEANAFPPDALELKAVFAAQDGLLVGKALWLSRAFVAGLAVAPTIAISRAAWNALQEERKADDIGKEAGNEQQDAGDHDHRRVQHLLARRAALLA